MTTHAITVDDAVQLALATYCQQTGSCFCGWEYVQVSLIGHFIFRNVRTKDVLILKADGSRVSQARSLEVALRRAMEAA